MAKAPNGENIFIRKWPNGENSFFTIRPILYYLEHKYIDSMGIG